MAASWSQRSRWSSPQSAGTASCTRSLPAASIAAWATLWSAWSSSGRIAGPADALPTRERHLEREQQQFGVLSGQHVDQVGDGVRALALEGAEPGVPPNRVLAVGDQLAEDRRLDVARREPDGAVAHRRRGVLQRRQDGAFAARLARGRLQRSDALGGREGSARHTCSRETRCRRASDSPARLLAAPLICSTATRFCRDTTAIASTAFTTISPPCFCSVTASDIWWVS